MFLLNSFPVLQNFPQITGVLSVLVIAFFYVFLISSDKVKEIRLVSLSASLVALSLGVVISFSFNQSISGFQFNQSFNLFSFNNLSFTLGIDGLSFVFLLLTLFVFPICFVSSWAITKGTKSFFLHLLAIEILLVLTFTTTDLFYFFIFFESLLIPMFILIGVWGARERKIKASYLFFLYTLFGSLVILFGVLYLYLVTGSTNFFVLLNIVLDSDQQKIIWLCFFTAFAVKIPLYPFHIWLPEAHVEAPTVGSILLASLLLKLGGYGFLRFSISILGEGSNHYSSLVSVLSLLGVIYGSLSTIRQIDFKRVIAYSSVAHINLVILGLFSYSQQGIEGATYLMVGHGVVSTALFFCVGVVYDRYHSRLLRYYGGLVTTIPIFVFFFFCFTIANMGFPGTSNFLGELLLFLGVFEKNSLVLLLATSGVVLSAVYSVWLFNRTCFGTVKTNYIARFTEITRRETNILTVLLISMLLLGVSANFVLEYLHTPVKLLLA